MIYIPCGISIAFSFLLFWLVSRVTIRGSKGHTATPADDACYDELETCYVTVSVHHALTLWAISLLMRWGGFQTQIFTAVW